MFKQQNLPGIFILGLGLLLLTGSALLSDDKPSSYTNVVEEPLPTVIDRMTKEKPAIMERQSKLLQERYQLDNLPAPQITMSKGKAVQGGVRIRLSEGSTWDSLAAATPDEIKQKKLWPKGFLPLPHPNHPEGGMLFPKFHIDEIKKQEARDLTRFDLDFDLPDHFLPEFPAPIYLTTRPDLGDVS